MDIKIAAIEAGIKLEKSVESFAALPIGIETNTGWVAAFRRIANPATSPEWIASNAIGVCAEDARKVTTAGAAA